jgi:hypothetical protein
MSDYVNKMALLRRLDREYTRFCTAITSLTAADMERPGVVGEWSLKDVIAHFIAHEQFALHELSHALRGEIFATVEGDLAAINARAVAERRHQSPAEVLQDWNASHQAVIAAVEGLSEADFEPDSPLVAQLGDTIDGALGNNSYDHYREHLPAVEAWIQQQDSRAATG